MSTHFTHINNSTSARRAALAKRLDKFCTLSWNGVDAWEQFGCFIINEKNSLKFYNGPSFSNSYTSPMFTDEAGALTGLKFSTQSISFTVGVYWITEEEYRKFIHWLNPYAVGALAFSFEPYWTYNVKLAGMKDSIRYPIGKDENGKDTFYTEMSLTFEIQGQPCAIRSTPYVWQVTSSTANRINFSLNPQYDGVEGTGNVDSDLPTGFEIKMPIHLNVIKSDTLTTSIKRKLMELNKTDPDASLDLILKCKVDAKTSYELLNLRLFHLSYMIENANATEFNFDISYDSVNGLCQLKVGDTTKLLTRIESLSNGERLVKSMNCAQFQFPGKFDQPDFDRNKIELELSVGGDVLKYIEMPITANDTTNENRNVKITMFAKTNLI